MHNEEYSASARSNTRYDESLFIHYQNKNSPFKHENIDALKLKEEEKNENLKTYSPQTNSEKKQMIRNNSFSFTENSDFSDSTVKFFNSNKEDLLKIFQFYCSLGEPMNTSKMKSNKFKKMLNDSNILINVC